MAKVEGLIGVVIGLIAGLVFFLVGSALQTVLQSAEVDGASGLMAGGAIGIIALPIMYGIFGFIGGAIGALLYNLIAGWIGGIEIELENK